MREGTARAPAKIVVFLSLEIGSVWGLCVRVGRDRYTLLLSVLSSPHSFVVRGIMP